MTDFIPYPPNGNPKQMHPEFVSAGAKVRAKTTARAGGDAQPLEAEASVYTADLQLQNIRSFNQMSLPSDENFPSQARFDYEIMLSGFVYLDPAGGTLDQLDIPTVSALTVQDHRDRIQEVVTGDNPLPAGQVTAQQIPDGYTGYIAYDLEQPTGFVQGLTTYPLTENQGLPNDQVESYDNLDAAGQTAADQVIAAVAKTLIAHHLEFPTAKLAVYGLGWTPANGARTSTDEKVGTYLFRKDMYKRILEYTDVGTSIRVADIVDLALAKQYANAGWKNFTYPLSFDPATTATNTFQNGIRESFRWMLPQVLGEVTGTDHIKVAVLSSQNVEGAAANNELDVFDWFAANPGTTSLTNDAQGKFMAMQYKQAQTSWAEAGMSADRLLPLYVWGAPDVDTKSYYNQSALWTQDAAMNTFTPVDYLVITDSSTGASSDPDPA